MVKIDIISGFLGAGKTTLIKKLLKDGFQGEQVVLIENEFGEIGIDGGFLKEAGIQIREMNSGCICCSLVGDFGTSLKEVVTKYDPDRILIEPSGVGKLSDVIKAVQGVQDEVDIKLNSYTTVVDAKKCKMYMKNFGEFFDNQIQYAGAIIMSRTDIASEKKVQESLELLRSLNKDAAIITTPIENLDGKKLVEVMEHPVSLEQEMLEEEHEHHHHHDGECGCGHDHEEHEHHHHHDGECGCGHDHEEHEHHHHDGECGCGHDHEEHEHHHHDGECGCGHDHEEHEHHHHDGECGCGHDHEEHEHHHHDGECGCGHDHEEHEHHHHHDGECGCGHDHHHHHADEVFTSWGRETIKKYTREGLEKILEALSESDKYGIILRAKGMLPAEDGTWIYFDMVPEETEIREGAPEYTGRLCVIGSKLDEHALEELFGIA
ncbi:CobW family GTP-binding protein [Blautia massiliensis (ex Durand et al. 2017)]|uniref:CobW family GTP-binding protein n=1 Tax=Blautia massiliensis (ex Durand et al. 2017) TaxID=1737424 RepID=UPI00156E79D3|nr:CobW family GTP-binding protein [Blautia massiliensis (ex Durand et al. 2017)]NSK96133.1 GTP-binding protein [Blautia massiliensis (ex Durand et al. 2017)]